MVVMELEKNMTKSTLDRIRMLGIDVRDPQMDGYFNFAAKQKLYKILWEAEKELAMCQSFVGEDEWLEEQGRTNVV